MNPLPYSDHESVSMENLFKKEGITMQSSKQDILMSISLSASIQHDAIDYMEIHALAQFVQLATY